MAEIQLAVATIVAIIHDQVGVAKVGHIGDDHITYFTPVLFDDDPLVALFFIEVEVEIFDEIFGQVVAQEGDIILHLAHLEEFLAALAWFAAKPILLLSGGIIPTSLDIL